MIGIPADKGPGALQFLLDLPLPEFLHHFVKSHIVEGTNAIKLLVNFPMALTKANPELTIIGFVSLLILFGMPFLPFKAIKKVPSQMIVLIVAVLLGMYFDLSHKHTYSFPDHFLDFAHRKDFEIEPEKNLVNIPDVFPSKSSETTDAKKQQPAFFVAGLSRRDNRYWNQIHYSFSLIGSLESLLSAKAIDLIDPWHRKTNFNRDLVGTGICNTIAASIGALPMISEIVRSSVNINNGARTKYANFFTRFSAWLCAFAA